MFGPDSTDLRYCSGELCEHDNELRVYKMNIFLTPATISFSRRSIPWSKLHFYKPQQYDKDVCKKEYILFGTCYLGNSPISISIDVSSPLTLMSFYSSVTPSTIAIQQDVFYFYQPTPLIII